MNKGKMNRGRRLGFNVGSASVIMVFAVLCLTIFSVLSLMTSNSDLRLSRRASKSIEDYYYAEYLAEGRVIDIKERLRETGKPEDLLKNMDGVEVFESGTKTAIRFIQTVDSRRNLHVELALYPNKTLSVTGWKLIPNDSDWSPDDGISVWVGE